MNIKGLGSWQQTRNVIFETLAMTIDRQNAAPESHDANSDYQRLQRLIDKLLEDAKTHAINGFRIVDDNIGATTVVKNLGAQSKAAKKEADRIKESTKKIAELTKLVGDLSKLVIGFGRL